MVLNKSIAVATVGLSESVSGPVWLLAPVSPFPTEESPRSSVESSTWPQGLVTLSRDGTLQGAPGRAPLKSLETET